MSTTENQNIEYKQSWRDEYLKWICGFANAQGGVLEIGKNDRGEAVGLSESGRLLEELPNKIRDLLGIMADVDLVGEGKEFIRITVEPYPYPISYRGEYHYRSGSTNQTLKGAALDQFLLGKQGRHWDAVPVPKLSLSDLDARILKDFRKRAIRTQRLPEEVLKESDTILIEKLRLTEGSYLKRASLLLFHPEPEAFVTGSFVKIGYFRTNSDLLYQDEVHGDLFTQVDKTVDLLRTKYLKALISYEGIQRVETFPVPGDALREAVTNAILHKNYGTHVPIQISVYDDRLMIWNSGQLPAGWSVDRLTRKHPSQPFNPEIANVFFLAGMIESWGRGIERVMDACRKANTPAPEFREEDAGLWVNFSFPSSRKTSPKTTQKTTQKTGEKAREKTRKRILELITDNPSLSLQELANEIGISRNGIVWQIKKLKKEKILERVGPDKGGGWKILKEEGE